MARYKLVSTDGHRFQFTRRWFLNRNRTTFEDHVLPEWAGKPCVYLEIGVFEAMSMVWMLQNVLTHPDSRAVGIDPWLMTMKLDEEFMDGVRERAFHNVKPWDVPLNGSKRLKKCVLQRANSVEAVQRMRRWRFHGIRRNTVDVCMLDGAHNALLVWQDAKLCYDLLKKGGWMIFDDVENRFNHWDHVGVGIQNFRKDRGGMELLWKDRFMECYVKTEE